MPDLKNAYLEAAKAEDLADLLNHIAWSDVVLPALTKYREDLTKQLVNATLGIPLNVQTASGPVPISREQLAGRIAGLDWLTTLFTKILESGGRSKDFLQKNNISL